MSSRRVFLKVICVGDSGNVLSLRACPVGDSGNVLSLRACATGVGKTALLHQAVQHKFSTSYRATIGADFLQYDIEVEVCYIA
jgi:Cdc6-like AAA superfamily ATPase